MNTGIRIGSTSLYYLLSDHLGGTNVTVTAAEYCLAAGVEYGEVRYKAFGDQRYASGTTPTSYRYTGQRQEAGIGLYFYGARWYDAVLGRFIQPDTIIPESQGIQAWDRFAYTNNNPLNFIDPTGHSVDCALGEDDCEEINEVAPEPPPIENPEKPPDFDNLNPEGNPPPPHVPGLPDDEWEYGDWPHLGEGYRNRKDPWETVYRPDRGFDDPRQPWGEQPHWNMRRPGQTGDGVNFPSNPEWGRPGQRPGPGVFKPGKDVYVIVLITAGTAVGFQIISSFGFGGGGGGGILLENMVR